MSWCVVLTDCCHKDLETFQCHSWGLFLEWPVFDGSNPGTFMADETTCEQWLAGGDVPLLKAIADGTIPKPSRLQWQEWQKWRKDPFGGRRATKMLGSTRPSTNGEESKLWQAVMESLYGANWLADLHGQESEVEGEEEDSGTPVHAEGEGHQVAPSTVGEPPPGLEQEPSCSAASVPPSPPPKTPPAFKKSLSPRRAAAATPSGSGRTGTEIPLIPSSRKLEDA